MFLGYVFCDQSYCIDIVAIAACRQAADRTCPDAYISLPHNYQAYFVMRTTYTPSIYCLLISQDLGFDPPCSTPIRCPLIVAAVVLSLNIRNNNIVNYHKGKLLYKLSKKQTMSFVSYLTIKSIKQVLNCG